MARDIEVGGIDIGASSAKVGIEGQGLIELTRHMEPYILRQAAVVGIEVAVVPLVATVEHTVAVGPAVVAAHGQHILTLLDVRCQVEAEGHHAIVAETHLLAVQPHVSALPCSLELNEDLSLFKL